MQDWRAVTLRSDTVDRLCDWLKRYGHMARVGVNQSCRVEYQSNVTCPEEQIVAFKQTIRGECFTQLLGLLVAVARTGDTARQARRLNKAGTVDAPGRIAAPEVGGPEENLGNGGGVRCKCIDAVDVLARDVTDFGLNECGGFRQRCQF